MKTKTFNLLLAGMLVLTAFASPASAQTTIRIVASNGDRTATQTAISKLLSSWVYRGVGGTADSGTPSTLSVATGSNFGAWNGTYNASPVIIKVSYSGALAGIAAVAGAIDQRFVATDGTGSGGVNNPLTSTNPADYEVAKADFGFSTNFQSTSPFNGLFQGNTYSQVVEEIVGITPLGFYASPGFPGSPSSSNPSFVPNITTQLARQLYTQGAVSLALFTGDWATDKNKMVYALGRNTDAGQRYGAHTEIGLGTTTQVRQWFPAVSGTTTGAGNIVYGGVASGHELWPVAQQPGTFAVPLASGGYSSGALVAQNLTVTLDVNAYKSQYFDADTNQNLFLYPNATAGYYIGYVTPGDAANRILGGNGVVPAASRGVALSFNGVANTTANVKNGSYTAWVYNRILKPQSGLSGNKLTFANALRDQIKDVDAPSGGGLFDDATVFVRRLTDGGAVVPK
ncbi:MAG: hypothetical protein JWO89_1303 [Verrucomicrobiaceae bacterium]|nr:hypothetical protein [Verrucomicrobiaceae bacterium]